MAILKLQVDDPIEGVLKYSKGKFYESNYGKAGRMMYSLQSDDVMFLDIDVCDEPDMLFANVGVGVGDPFRLTLRKRMRGARFYEVRRLSEAAEPAQEPSQIERELNASLNHYRQQRAASTPSKATPPAAAKAGATPRPLEPTQQVNPIAIVPAPERPRAGSLMASALVASIDAVIIAQEYAAAKSLPLVFGPEDVRAIAATLYIQHGKDSQYQRPAVAR